MFAAGCDSQQKIISSNDARRCTICACVVELAVGVPGVACDLSCRSRLFTSLLQSFLAPTPQRKHTDLWLNIVSSLSAHFQCAGLFCCNQVAGGFDSLLEALFERRAVLEHERFLQLKWQVMCWLNFPGRPK